MRSQGEKNLSEQIEFLLKQYASGSVDIHKTMQLIGMAYGDFLDFYSGELPEHHERQELEKTLRELGYYCAAERRK